MSKKMWLALTGAALLGVAAIAGCGSAKGTTNPTGAKAGGKIDIDMPDQLTTLDPAMAYTLLDNDIVFQLYDQLVTYKPASSDITGDIASSWTISPDGRTYTFHLKKGVKFWNGDAVTAQSFIDEFERVLSPKLGSPGEGFLDPVVVGSTAYNKGTARTVKGLSAPNPYTLVIKLNQPEPYFLQVLAQEFFSPVDQQYINKIGDKAFASQPMGTGPFQLKSYQQSREMVLVKNPHYFQPGKPKLGEVDISIESNVNLSAERFQQGKTAFINFNQTIDPADFASMMNDPKWKGDFRKETLNTLAFLNINNADGPLKSKLVRQAISYAINRQNLVKLQAGTATVANQILPPHIPGYESSLPKNATYDYNPTKAKQLLAKAGYGKGFSTEILVLNDPTNVKLVEAIQANLSAIGINASVKALAHSAYSPLAHSGKEPMVFEIWSQDYPDPSDFLDSFLNSRNIPNLNFSHYDNPVVDSELNKAANMPSGLARLAVYQKVQNQALAAAALVPLYYPEQYALVQPWVKGFYMNPVRYDPFQDISVTAH